MRLMMTTIALVTCSTLAHAGDAENAAILKVHEDFASSWNKNDFKAMAATFADDADLISPTGRLARGRAEIEKLYKDEQTTTFKGSRFTSDCRVRKLKPDVAVVTCSFEVTDGKLPDGKAMPPLKGIYTATMLETKHKWLIVTGRPMIPFAPPKP